MSMREPMKIDPENIGVQVTQQCLGVEVPVVEHHTGQIENADPITVSMKLGGHRCESERIHLEDGGRWYEVADRPVEYRFPPKIIDARSVNKDEILFRQVGTSYENVGERVLYLNAHLPNLLRLS
jgi:hypothetical protein